MRKLLDGQSVASVSREIGVNESLIHKWKQTTLEKGDGVTTGTELAEIQALKKWIRELEQENEILTKAALFFGFKETPQIS